MKKHLFIFPALMILVGACSPSKEAGSEDRKEEQTIQWPTIKKEAEEVYIFDDVGEIEEPKENLQITVEYQYFVQVGAFSEHKRAQDFAKTSKPKLNMELSVQLSEFSGLFTVWTPSVSTRAEADALVTKIRNQKDFKDAFIVRTKK